MNREDIYDHLAQVYLGKRKESEVKKKRHFNAWLVINIFIMLTIFSSAFYGLTAFFAQKRESTLKDKIIFSLHSGLIRLSYDFVGNFPPTKSFSLEVPSMDVSKYNNLEFTIRGREEGTPGVVKIVFENQRNEKSSYYVQGVDLDWQDVKIPLSEFKQITDWSTIKDVSFVLESWNVDKKKGILLLDNVGFSSIN